MKVHELSSEVLRVLLVDDNVDDVRQVRELLRGQGQFHVSGARRVDEIPALVRDGSFDALLVDSGIWEREGIDLVEGIQDRAPELAIVVIAPGADESIAFRARRAGAHDVLGRERLLDGAHLARRISESVHRARSRRRRDTVVRWLNRDARTDHLTGLYNRAAFERHLEEQCAAARRDGGKLALLLVDVVDTVSVNAAHGRAEGDAMIRRAASCVAWCVRGSDIAARYEGDTFAVLLGDAGLELAQQVARRIAHRIDHLNATDWANDIPVTVTFGLACGEAPTPEQLVEAAMAQLEARKSLRRTPLPLRLRRDEDGPSVA